jgi:hypothetical protein
MKIVILLILILLIIVPQELINQDKLTNKLADLESRLGAMESARQPYVGDWYSFSVASVSYSSATRITITDITITALLRIGDKIKITQTTDKYFYIVNVNSTSIDVFAGDDYSVANAPITYLGFSRLANPSGHPVVFSYTHAGSDCFPDAGAGFTLSNISYVSKVYMIGKYVFVSAFASFNMSGAGGGGNYYINCKFPILRTAGASYIVSSGLLASIVGNSAFRYSGESHYDASQHSLGAIPIGGGSASNEWSDIYFAGATHFIGCIYYYGINNQ